jgi:hypothetical protein
MDTEQKEQEIKIVCGETETANPLEQPPIGQPPDCPPQIEPQLLHAMDRTSISRKKAIAAQNRTVVFFGVVLACVMGLVWYCSQVKFTCSAYEAKEAYAKGDLKLAERLFRDAALEQWKSAGRDRHFISITQQLSWVLEEEGDFDGALKQLSIYRQFSPPEELDCKTAWTKAQATLASVPRPVSEMSSDDLVAAQHACQTALNTLRSYMDKHDPGLIPFYRMLGEINLAESRKMVNPDLSKKLSQASEYFLLIANCRRESRGLSIPAAEAYSELGRVEQALAKSLLEAKRYRDGVATLELAIRSHEVATSTYECLGKSESPQAELARENLAFCRQLRDSFKKLAERGTPKK